MTARLDVDYIQIIHIRTDIAVTFRYFSKRQQTIQTTYQISIHLNRWYKFSQTGNQFGKQAVFEGENLFFRS